LCMTVAAASCSDTGVGTTSAETGSGSSVTSGPVGTAAASSPAGTAAQSSSQTAAAAQLSAVLSDTSEMFTDRDYETGFSDCTEITLSDGGSAVSGAGASVSGNTVTVTSAGTYRLSGTLTDGQIVIDAGDEKVQLVLNGVSVTTSGSTALYIKSADKVFVTTEYGTVNTFASSGEAGSDGDDKIDGTVFARSDITFNGNGNLTVSSEKAHGIVCKDDVKITSGEYEITAAKKGIDSNESVRAAGGTVTVMSGTDGIHAENSDEPEDGFVFISGGSFTIISGGDAIDASGEIAVPGGEITVTAGGGADNASSSDTAKGIKSDTLITLCGGVLIIDSSDDAVHSNGGIVINSGTVKASTADDGIHAETSLLITDGDIDISRSSEGAEGRTVEISGGNIRIRSSDDGINAAGGDSSSGGMGGMMDADADAYITISGGNITVNADGDGIDSNGYLYVTGGTTFVSGPVNSGNGALDFGISAKISGGYLIAAGSAGMAENFGTDSTQGSILYNFGNSLAAGTEIALLDADGNEIISYTPEKQFMCAVISAPEITSGKTYTISAGGNTYSVEMTSLIYGAGSGMNGFGGFGGHGGFGGSGGMVPGQDGSMP
ncbi:MAG: carbohydrate-binding domain-containing protein, partial [Ruminiclostridium sp.]|nr:carbohydrate-binding domain-containing protein [Ruminiclostridium sp.]